MCLERISHLKEAHSALEQEASKQLQQSQVDKTKWNKMQFELETKLEEELKHNRELKTIISNLECSMENEENRLKMQCKLLEKASKDSQDSVSNLEIQVVHLQSEIKDKTVQIEMERNKAYSVQSKIDMLEVEHSKEVERFEQQRAALMSQIQV